MAQYVKNIYLHRTSQRRHRWCRVDRT